MGLAGIVARGGLLFASGGVEEVRRSGRIRRMILLGFVVALEMIFYFASIRTSNVTVGVSLEYMAPVWVAVLAPWLLRTRRQRIDMVAVAVAVGGMALLVLPGRDRRGHGSTRCRPASYSVCSPASCSPWR